jgi:magnesium transporter
MPDSPPPPRRSSRRLRQPTGSAPGSPPGTLVPDPGARASRVHAFAYTADAAIERAIAQVDELAVMRQPGTTLWVNVDGVGDAAALTRLGELFGLHRLMLEDVMHQRQRPKTEQYGDQLFVVTRMVRLPDGGDLVSEQVCLVLGGDFVITFQEGSPGDCLDPVRQRLRGGNGRMRAHGPDYLAYAILDAVTDGYFPVLEHFGEQLEVLEDATLGRSGPELVQRIHDVRRDLLFLRRQVWPMREMMNGLYRSETPLIADATRVYLRDCYDHAVQLMDILENYRELASGLMEVYLSSIGLRTNEIVRVLTVISTTFMPLTFIAGVYGMNFDTRASPWNMPELGWWLGYPLALLLMAATAGVMLLYFYRVGWIGRQRRRR